MIYFTTKGVQYSLYSIVVNVRKYQIVDIPWIDLGSHRTARGNVEFTLHAGNVPLSAGTVINSILLYSESRQAQGTGWIDNVSIQSYPSIFPGSMPATYLVSEKC